MAERTLSAIEPERVHRVSVCWSLSYIWLKFASPSFQGYLHPTNEKTSREETKPRRKNEFMIDLKVFYGAVLFSNFLVEVERHGRRTQLIEHLPLKTYQVPQK